MQHDPTNVLLIEDDHGYADLVRLTLAADAPQFILVHTDRLSTGLERLGQGGIDVILLDLSLPDSGGLDTFVETHAHAGEVPIVVLTGLDDEMLTYEALRRGAQDYLVKIEVDGPLLARSLRYAIERSRLLARLEQSSEERFRNMIEQNADAIVILDGNGIVRFANPAAESHFGCKVEELLDDLFGFPVSAGETTEIDVIRRDGEIATAEMRVVETQWQGEDAYLASLRDISERKKAREELQSAKEAAEAASRAKSQFLANVSHELRTPMNGIIGMTELALDTELTSEQWEYLSMIKDSADSLLTLLNDVLDSSKIEAGKLELEPVPFNLRDCLKDIVATLGLRGHQKGLQLACHTLSVVPDALVGDPRCLRQIIVNLVGNAIKFTERGGVVVHVESESEKKGEVYLHFAISDTGIGIPPEKQQVIFEAFTQADSTTTRQFGGTGLGLTIASQLIAMMDGKIWVQSEVGKGSTFHFTARFGLQRGIAPSNLTKKVDVIDIPGLMMDDYGKQRSISSQMPANGQKSRASSGRPLSDPRGEAEEPTGPVAGGDRPGLHILIAEDNIVNQRLAARILEKRGHRIQVANNGVEALAALEAGSYDLILMDVQMPELDGTETTVAIREKEKMTGAHIPIVAVTAHVMGGDREYCLDAGMDAYISKPLQAEKLIQVVEELVSAVDGMETVPSEESLPRPAFDREATLARVEGDVELLAEIVELFFDNAPRLLSDIQEPVSRRDAVALERAAHALKGAVGNFSAEDAFNSALKLEVMGSTGDLNGVDEAYADLETKIANLKNALATLRKEIAA